MTDFREDIKIKGGSLSIEDGTEGAGKVLTSDVDGLATWAVAGGADGNGIYDGTGSMVGGATIVNQLGNTLTINPSDATGGGTSFNGVTGAVQIDAGDGVQGLRIDHTFVSGLETAFSVDFGANDLRMVTGATESYIQLVKGASAVFQMGTDGWSGSTKFKVGAVTAITGGEVFEVVGSTLLGGDTQIDGDTLTNGVARIVDTADEKLLTFYRKQGSGFGTSLQFNLDNSLNAETEYANIRAWNRGDTEGSLNFNYLDNGTVSSHIIARGGHVGIYQDGTSSATDPFAVLELKSTGTGTANLMTMYSGVASANLQHWFQDNGDVKLAYTSGNIGIGITGALGARLHVGGDTQIDGNVGINTVADNNNALTVRGTGTTTAKSIIVQDSLAVETFIVYDSGGVAIPTGNLGVNTFADNNNALTIKGNGTAAHKSIHIKDSLNVDTFYLQDNGYSYFAAEVAIGVTPTLSAMLHVGGDTLIDGALDLNAASGATSALDVNQTLISSGQYNLLKLSETGSKRIEALSTAGGTGLRLFDTDGTTIGVNLLSGLTSDNWLALTGDLGIGTATPSEKADILGNVRVSGHYKVGANQVVGARGASVADATDAASAITQLNLVITRLEAHGLIATV